MNTFIRDLGSKWGFCADIYGDFGKDGWSVLVLCVKLADLIVEALENKGLVAGGGWMVAGGVEEENVSRGRGNNLYCLGFFGL